MLTKLQISNFKKLNNVEIELGNTVVFIGPNNSGKTTALQALALWEIGLRQWIAKRGLPDHGEHAQNQTPRQRPGVTINRRDLIAIPVPDANLLWRNLHVRKVERGKSTSEKHQQTQNIRIDILVEGVSNGSPWRCGLEFDYANQESFYCRPLRQQNGDQMERMNIPAAAAAIRVVFLPPMSGLTAIEPKWEPGRINVLLGEGQTAQVLRNLCYQVYAETDRQETWQTVVTYIQQLFGVKLLAPHYLVERGEITMAYEEPSGTQLDLSSAGRGLQQTLLLLTHLYANPGAVLLLDEPDAHLEILRQRQMYQLLTTIAQKQGSQIIAASHSEVVLNEAADRDIVIAFVGQPHRIDDRGTQVVKALREIGFDHYYQAEQTGWVLYLEGSTDLAILRAFAEILEHPASTYLERPFVVYVGNVPNEVRKHFWGIQEAKADLVGVAIFDRLSQPLPDGLGVTALMWQRREIENYLCQPAVLLAYARDELPVDAPLFDFAEIERRSAAMQAAIAEVGSSLETLRNLTPWSPDTKVTDDFLDPLFRRYFGKIGLPNLLCKSDYHILARFLTKEEIALEVTEKLDAIFTVAQSAKPRQD